MCTVHRSCNIKAYSVNMICRKNHCVFTNIFCDLLNIQLVTQSLVRCDDAVPRTSSHEWSQAPVRQDLGGLRPQCQVVAFYCFEV